MKTSRNVIKKSKECVIYALIVAQVILLCYLLALDIPTTILVSVLCGLPIAILCNALLQDRPHLRYTDMSVVMFSAGGFGMLIGCIVDLGQLGLYGLLSWCQSSPSAQIGTGLETFLTKAQLTPWTYVGMFAGGNIGMFLSEKLTRNPPGQHRAQPHMYLICNIGMWVGMLAGESAAMMLIDIASLFWSALAMVVFMLLGMILGMIAFLNLSDRIKDWRSAIPSKA